MRITKAEIKLLRSLKQKKFRDRERMFLVEGRKVAKDALASDFRVEFVAMTRQVAEDHESDSIAKACKEKGVGIKELTELELGQVTDTVHAQGVIALVHQRSTTIENVLAKNPDLLVLADHIADPGNVGTMIRTCDWFGADALILSDGCVQVYNEKVVRSTSGSVFHLPFVEHVNIPEVLALLRKGGFRIFATSGESAVSYRSADFGTKNAVVFGNEANGVHADVRALTDGDIAIPGKGKAESLNVGVACGVILSHLRVDG